VDSLRQGEQVFETFTYTVSDGTATDTETLKITITGTNDNPVASDDSNQIFENGTSVDQSNGSGSLISNDTDSDGDDLNVASITSVNVPANTSNDPGTTVTGQYGTISWSNNGNYTYTLTAPLTLAAGASVTDVFDYIVSDANGDDTGRLTITIKDQTYEIRIVKNRDGAEGGINPRFYIQLFNRGSGLQVNNTTGSAISVRYSISGTAINGTDYTTLTGITTIANATNQRVLNVTVTNDAFAECSDESVIVTLLSTSAVQVGTPSTATAYIADNDNVTPAVAISDICSGGAITVDITGASNLPNGMYDFKYNIDGGTVQTKSSVAVSGGVASFNISGIAAGSHTLNLTAVCDKTITGVSDTFVVNAPSTAASIVGTTSICAGESADLIISITGGSSPYTVSLSDGSVLTNYAS
ncbi:MAG: Ig-like domain-containing protein, partial [Marinoscillum sp.]